MSTVGACAGEKDPALVPGTRAPVETLWVLLACRTTSSLMCVRPAYVRVRWLGCSAGGGAGCPGVGYHRPRLSAICSREHLRGMWPRAAPRRRHEQACRITGWVCYVGRPNHRALSRASAGQTHIGGVGVRHAGRPRSVSAGLARTSVWAFLHAQARTCGVYVRLPWENP